MNGVDQLLREGGSGNRTTTRLCQSQYEYSCDSIDVDIYGDCARSLSLSLVLSHPDAGFANTRRKEVQNVNHEGDDDTHARAVEAALISEFIHKTHANGLLRVCVCVLHLIKRSPRASIVASRAHQLNFELVFFFCNSSSFVSFFFHILRLNLT